MVKKVAVTIASCKFYIVLGNGNRWQLQFHSIPNNLFVRP